MFSASSSQGRPQSFRFPAQSGILGVSVAVCDDLHEGGLARTFLGHRLLRCGSSETTQDAVRTADQNQHEGAQSQVLQEPWGDHELDCQGGLVPRGCTVCAVGRCLPGKHAGRSLTWRLAVHECDPIHTCRVEPIVAWTEAVWDEQLDDVELHKAWRRQQRLVGLKSLWTNGKSHCRAPCWNHQCLCRTSALPVTHKKRPRSGRPWMVDTRGCEQGRSIRTPVLSEVRAISFGLSKSSIVILPSLS